MSSPAPSSRSAQHDRPRKAAPARRAALLVALVSLACVILLSVGSSAFAAPPGVRAGAPSCAPPPPYVVVVDAGSTGCRAHVFRVVPDRPRRRVRAPRRRKITLDVPLASFAGAPDAALADALLPMLDAAASASRPAIAPASRSTSGPPRASRHRRRRRPPCGTPSRASRAIEPVLRRGPPPGPAPRALPHHRGRGGGFFAWLAVNRLSGVNLRTSPPANQPPSPPRWARSTSAAAPRRSSPRAATPSRVSLRKKPRGRLHRVASGRRLRQELPRLRRDAVGPAQIRNRRRRQPAETPLRRTPAVPRPRGTRSSGRRSRGDAPRFGRFRRVFGLVRGVVARARERTGVASSAAGRRRGAFVGVSLTYHLTGFLARAFPGELASFPTPTMREVGRWRRARAPRRGTARGWFDGVDPNTSSDRLPGGVSTRRWWTRCWGTRRAADGDEGGFGSRATTPG